jgi:hypothetical protein
MSCMATVTHETFIRNHKRTQGRWTVRAFRGPALHGLVSMFSLWEELPDRKIVQRVSAMQLPLFRRALGELK